MPDFPPPPSTTLDISPTVPTVSHRGPHEEITVNKYHLLYIIKGLQMKPKGPKLEYVFVALGFFVPTLITLLVSNFRDYLGYPAAFWQASAFIFMVLSGATTIILFALWIRGKRQFADKTPEQLYEEICTQVDKELERAKGNSKV